MTKESKPDRLRQMGALNPRPEGVRASWFREAGFFDPLDLVQVKYEMLRHAREDGTNKADAAALFGLSRQTYYQAEAAFERDGISGLLPRTRGPKSAHKLTGEVMRLVEEHLDANGQLQARSLAELVHSRLGISVHPRSIERAVARKKNDDGRTHAITMSANGKEIYEALRADVVCGTACARRMGAIVFHGLWRGLAVLIAPHQSAIARQQSTPRLKTTSLVAHDRQLVHMLANMVLAAETGGSHVY
ncbi:helix-turn-helix domain-containing protein [Sinorhizobium medicae]|uniref:helix-turn-helix domain-containing protein n=2 Tax=Sinorhizobium TaxID=28105 RepID=UPI0030911172|nr:helix-turn-helix domain-containing protein [Sinorhizobium medicae]